MGVPIEPFSVFEPYGGASPPDRLVGQLLVATPRLADPNFARRVVLVLDHGEHGALGVVLDRPGGVPVGELLSQWHPLATAPAELFTGGPVARNALIGLVRLRARGPDPDLAPPVATGVEAPDRRRPSGGDGGPVRRPRLRWSTPCSVPACSPDMPDGSRTNSKTRSKRDRGMSFRPRPATRSPPIPRGCGGGC